MPCLARSHTARLFHACASRLRAQQCRTRRIDSEFESLEARFGRTLAELELHLSSASRPTAAAAPRRPDLASTRAAAADARAAVEVPAEPRPERVQPRPPAAESRGVDGVCLSALRTCAAWRGRAAHICWSGTGGAGTRLLDAHVLPVTCMHLCARTHA